MKKLFSLLGVLIIGAGIVLAISGAGATAVQEWRWNGAVTAGSDTTEGGNITAVNVSTTSLTDKWASYFGNVSGQITLDDDGTGPTAVYTWSWSPTAGGEVCVSKNSSFGFSTVDNATAADIDTAWSFTSGDADSAANTYTGSGCSLTFAQGSVTNASYADIQGSSAFNSCAVKDATNNYAFCTAINSGGVNYNNVPAQYELIVPTTEGAGTETYYFFLELN